LLKGFATQTENSIASVALGGIMLLPLAEIAARRFLGVTIPGSGAFAATLTLWLAMLGAAIAARDGKLLTLATGEFLPKGTISAVGHVVSGTIGAMIATIFALGGGALVRSDRIAGDQVTAGLATWVADLALPIGFGLIALRLVWRASPLWYGRAIAVLGIVAGVLLNEHRAMLENQSVLP
jgi:C4-dicarboxylate transporter DctM subunit